MKNVLSAMVLLLAVLVLPVTAQNYPTKPVRLLVGFPPGGTNDIIARLVAPKLAEGLGQQVVVENRGGANTAIATELAARASPDGYTIILNAPDHATNPALIKLAFDPIRDFAFISLLAESQNLLVTHPSFPPRSVRELIAFSKKHPGEINYGSSGIGTSVHLSAESGVPGYEVTNWFGIAVPAKTPPAIVERLNRELVRALNSPDLRNRLTGLGAEPVGNTPEQYQAFVQNEISKWGKVIKAAGIKGE